MARCAWSRPWAQFSVPASATFVRGRDPRTTTTAPSLTTATIGSSTEPSGRRSAPSPALRLRHRISGQGTSSRCRARRCEPSARRPAQRVAGLADHPQPGVALLVPPNRVAGHRHAPSSPDRPGIRRSRVGQPTLPTGSTADPPRPGIRRTPSFGDGQRAGHRGMDAATVGVVARSVERELTRRPVAEHLAGERLVAGNDRVAERVVVRPVTVLPLATVTVWGANSKSEMTTTARSGRSVHRHSTHRTDAARPVTVLP